MLWRYLEKEHGKTQPIEGVVQLGRGSIEYRKITRNGVTVYVQIRIKPVFDPETGKTKSVLLPLFIIPPEYMKNEDLRKKAEALIKALETDYEAIIAEKD